MEILTKRLAYIDAMRGFTMILVVFSHVQYFGYGEFIQSVYNFVWGGSCLIYRDLITLFFMPLFFFISGFVLYKPDVEWNYVALLFLATKFTIHRQLFYAALQSNFGTIYHNGYSYSRHHHFVDNQCYDMHKPFFSPLSFGR